MAGFSYSGFEGVSESLARQLLTREDIKEIVTAGGEAAVDTIKTLTEEYGHVRTGSMRDSIATEGYREMMGGGAIDAYPRGMAPTNQSIRRRRRRKNGEWSYSAKSAPLRQADKAFIINYGRTGSKPIKADHFLTSGRAYADQDEAARQAMQDRFSEIVDGK